MSSEIPELLILKIENSILKQRILINEQVQLVEEARKITETAAEWLYNPDLRKFQAPEETK